MEPIEGSPEMPRTSQHTIVLQGLREALNCVPIMQRDASLSDGQFEISQPGVGTDLK